MGKALAGAAASWAHTARSSRAQPTTAPAHHAYCLYRPQTSEGSIVPAQGPHVAAYRRHMGGYVVIYSLMMRESGHAVAVHYLGGGSERGVRERGPLWCAAWRGAGMSAGHGRRNSKAPGAPSMWMPACSYLSPTTSHTLPPRSGRLAAGALRVRAVRVLRWGVGRGPGV